MGKFIEFIVLTEQIGAKIEYKVEPSSDSVTNLNDGASFISWLISYYRNRKLLVYWDIAEVWNMVMYDYETNRSVISEIITLFVQ